MVKMTTAHRGHGKYCHMLPRSHHYDEGDYKHDGQGDKDEYRHASMSSGNNAVEDASYAANMRTQDDQGWRRSTQPRIDTRYSATGAGEPMNTPRCTQHHDGEGCTTTTMETINMMVKVTPMNMTPVHT